MLSCPRSDSTWSTSGCGATARRSAFDGSRSRSSIAIQPLGVLNLDLVRPPAIAPSVIRGAAFRSEDHSLLTDLYLAVLEVAGALVDAYELGCSAPWVSNMLRRGGEQLRDLGGSAP